MFSQLPYSPLANPVHRKATGSARIDGLRVCLVADTETPSQGRNGLSALLVEHGAQVTLLDLAPQPGPAPPGIEPITLGRIFEPQHDFTPLRAVRVYHWLTRAEPSAQPFDWVIFTDGFGAGYYSVVAKSLGLAFGHTALVVFAHTSHARTLEQQHRFPQGRTDIELDFLERRTVAGADMLITPGPDVLDWCRRAGWTLPPDCFDKPMEGLRTRLPTRVASALPKILPLVSVCLATYNRPEFLVTALASLKRQKYQPIEVIVIDDGSTDPTLSVYWAEQAVDFQARGWTLIRQANAGPGAARNVAVEHAKGDYLLFMDDDNIALAHEIERFMTAALISGADVLTCLPGRHPETTVGPPPVARLPTADPAYPLCDLDWTPVGASLALCTMINCLGDGNALYKRSVFKALGGFSESRSSFEDLRLLSLAVVRGYRLDVVPEILFLYRRHEGSRSMSGDLFHCHVDVLGPLTELVPPALWPLLLAVHGDWYQRHLSAAVAPSLPEPLSSETAD